MPKFPLRVNTGGGERRRRLHYSRANLYTACGRRAASVITTANRGDVGWRACLRAMGISQDAPGSPPPAMTSRRCPGCGHRIHEPGKCRVVEEVPGVLLAKATRVCRCVLGVLAQPIRSAAEERPATTGTTPEPLTPQEPTTAKALGFEVVRQGRLCCPDAGAWRCHKQAPGMCRCWACRRMEREWRRFFLREVRKFIAAAPMPANDKRAARQKLARVLRILLGQARSAEQLAEQRREKLRLIERRWSAAHAATLKAEKERDEALAQVRASAERARGARQAAEELERERAAQDRADAARELAARDEGGES